MPVHSAPHDRSFFQMINFYIAIGVVIFGIYTGEVFLASLGLIVGLVYWFTTPRYYHVMSDRLVVMYGQPRVLAVPFETIFDVNIVRVPLSSGIFVPNGPTRPALSSDRRTWRALSTSYGRR